ncbi:hypothetical protein FQN50_005212 [Emmonsiellopsis sp. PD_5]|nr:hypothetical protein FQN50_005212 [Emmonsiellopsis sp. PD_5]
MTVMGSTTSTHWTLLPKDSSSRWQPNWLLQNVIWKFVVGPAPDTSVPAAHSNDRTTATAPETTRGTRPFVETTHAYDDEQNTYVIYMPKASSTSCRTPSSTQEETHQGGSPQRPGGLGRRVPSVPVSLKNVGQPPGNHPLGAAELTF